MIDEGDLVAVGVSGGKDSLALLCALAQLREFYPKKFDVVALMLDKGFDKSESISAPPCDLSGIEELCLTTNGTRLEQLAAPLKEAGVDRLNISLDTLRPERYREITRTGKLENVLRGIEAAERAGFENIKLNCVLLGGMNDDEIGDFVRLTAKKPWQVRFIELMPMGVCAAWPPERFLPAREVLSRVPELRPAGRSGVAQLYRLPGAAGTVGLIEPMSCAFCADCTRIRITADGKLKPCLHSDAELALRGLSGAELEAAIRRGILMKPARHRMDETGVTETHRGMFAIGG